MKKVEDLENLNKTLESDLKENNKIMGSKITEAEENALEIKEISKKLENAKIDKENSLKNLEKDINELRNNNNKLKGDINKEKIKHKKIFLYKKWIKFLKFYYKVNLNLMQSLECYLLEQTKMEI